MSTPMTAPSGEQQVKLLTRLYKETGVNPGTVDYIEAHGKRYVYLIISMSMFVCVCLQAFAKFNFQSQNK
jgi:hypothetical protein